MSEVFQNNPLIIGIIVLLLVLLIIIPVLIRRRRVNAEEVTPPIDVDPSMRDYTTEPYEEPVGFGERFRQMSIGSKLLLLIVPLMLIVVAVIGVLMLRSSGTANDTPAGPAPSISNVRANVASANKIVVSADTTLPNGAPVTIALKEGDQDFPWYNPDSATVPVNDGKVLATLERLNDGPTPRQDQTYSVVLSAQASDQTINSEVAALDVPAPLRDAFFQVVASAPPNTPTAPPDPTKPNPTPTSVPEPTTPPAPTATAGISLTATVFNGGNIRTAPRVEPCSCPQLHAGETVQLLERSSDGQWYRVIAPEGTGWVSVTLLRIDAAVATQVPPEGQQSPPLPSTDETPTAQPTGLTATVFNGGNIRTAPRVEPCSCPQLHAGETVQLLERSSDGQWYRVIAPEGTGWVNVTLLRIDAAVATQVPETP